MCRGKGHNTIAPSLCIATNLPVASASNLLSIAGIPVPQLGPLQELSSDSDIVDLLVEVARTVVLHILQNPSCLVDDKGSLRAVIAKLSERLAILSGTEHQHDVCACWLTWPQAYSSVELSCQ